MIDSISTIYGLLAGSFCNNLLNSATGRPDHLEGSGCYLENSETGVEDNEDRLQVTPWSRKKTQTVASPETKASA